MKYLLVIFLIFSGIVSANAVTCEDVRALSADQRAYYIKLYNISYIQQQIIKKTCALTRVAKQ